MGTNGIGSFDGARQILARIAPVLGAGAVLAVFGVLLLSRVGCVNIHTPPGHEGYVRSKPIVGAGKFVGIQKGPTSTGWVWRQEVINIDTRPRTYTEQMDILTKNGLNLTLRAHARVQLREGKVRDVVERFGGQDWYGNNVHGPFQSEVRKQVQQLEPLEVKKQMREIGDVVLQVMRERYADTPVEFKTVDVGDIQYPVSIVGSVINKFVTNQDNERKDIELKIAQQQIKIKAAQAAGTRDAQTIIRTTLDPMYLQYEALQAIDQLAGSQNTTFLVMPFTKQGSAPIIMNLGQ